MAKRCLIGVVGVGLLSMAAGCSRKPPRSARAAPVTRRPVRPAPRGAAPAPRRVEPVPRTVSEDVLRELGSGALSGPKLVDGPWAGAKVGQWARYGGQGGQTLTRKVVKVGKDLVTVEVTAVLGEHRATQTVEMPRRVPANQGAGSVPVSAKWTDCTLAVGGKELPCRLATWQRTARGKTRTRQVWLSDRVPGRLVRSGWAGKDDKVSITLELVDFGE